VLSGDLTLRYRSAEDFRRALVAARSQAATQHGPAGVLVADGDGDFNWERRMSKRSGRDSDPKVGRVVSGIHLRRQVKAIEQLTQSIKAVQRSIVELSRMIEQSPPEDEEPEEDGRSEGDGSI